MSPSSGKNLYSRMILFATKISMPAFNSAIPSFYHTAMQYVPNSLPGNSSSLQTNFRNFPNENLSRTEYLADAGAYPGNKPLSGIMSNCKECKYYMIISNFTGREKSMIAPTVLRRKHRQKQQAPARAEITCCFLVAKPGGERLLTNSDVC